MDVGTGLFTCQRRPDDERPFTALYDEMLTLGRTIDEAGLASAWVSEHHFADDGYLSGTMPALGALAAVTDDIGLGTGIALAPLYDPIRLVEDAATVDLIADGRMRLGLSIGYRDEEFERFNVPKEARVERTVEAVELARSAWRDGGLAGDASGHDTASITPPPPGDGPPIILGGAAKPAVRRAAMLGDGWMAPSSLDAAGLRVRIEDIQRVRAEEGLDDEPFQIYVLKHGFVAESAEAAWEAMRPGYFYLQRRYAAWYSGEPVSKLPAERREQLKEAAIFGEPADVADGLADVADVAGDDVHVILRTYYPGIGTDRMVETIHRLGDEVLPQLP